MAPTSWRSIEGGSSARPAAYDFLGVLISTVCTWNSFLKFRAILGKEGSLLILNQFSSYIPRAINLNRQGHERGDHGGDTDSYNLYSAVSGTWVLRSYTLY